MSELPLTWDPQFFSDLGSEDEIGLLVRLHLHVERDLWRYIERHTLFPEYLPQLSYSPAVELACALGLDHTYLGPLRALGKLRNHFGHKYDARLGDKEIADLLATLTKRDRDWIASAYEDAHRKRNVPGPDLFDDLPAANKLGLFVIVLRTVLSLAIEEGLQKGVG